MDDIEVIGEATDGEEATRLIPELGPDVVLLDMKLPSLNAQAARCTPTLDADAKKISI